MQNGMKEDLMEIDLREIIRIIFRQWWVVGVFFLISVTASFVLSFYVLQPVYKAEATLFVGKEGSKTGGIELGEIQLNDKLVLDYREIIKSRLAAREIIEKLNLDMSIEAFQKCVTVTTVNNSRLIKIAFLSSDPRLAMDVANALSEFIIKKAEDIVDVKNVQVIDAAEFPSRPIKPNKKMNLAIAGVVGIMAGIGVILIIEYLDSTLKNSEDVERYLGFNVIGEIPKFEGEKRNHRKKRNSVDSLSFERGKLSSNLISFHDPKARASEAYRALRTNIGFLGVDRQIKSIVVTSPDQAEGKSTTCANIAISMAQTDKKVLLLECDLRKPKIHKYFGVENDKGLTDVIVNNMEYEAVTRKIDQIKNLYVITCGPIPPNPAEILESAKMNDLINRLKDSFDMVILDSPPVSELTDAAIVSKNADGVILVIASGESNIDMARHAKSALENVKARVLGVVLTKLDRSSGSYHYYRYRNYYYYR